jgi:hypothetical protein
MSELITVPEFNIDNTKQYRLSIQVSLNGFSFSIINPDENKLLALHRSPATISSENFLARRFKEYIDQNDLLTADYAETSIIFHTGKFTLVPEEIYCKEKQADILQLLFGKQIINNSAVRDYPENMSSHLIYAVPNDLEKVFNNTFQDFSLNHTLTVLNNKIQAGQEKEEDTLLLYFEKKSFSLMLYSGGQLLLATNFNYNHENDIVFYITSVLKNQASANKNTKLLVSGDIDTHEPAYKTLDEYFNISPFYPAINYNTEVFQESPHRYITLCHTCAL